MSLSDDNIIQENSGGPGSAGTVSLLSGTTAGSTVIVIRGSTGTPPAGWTTDRTVATQLGVYRLADTAAGQTSWSFGADDSPWYVVEMSNLDLADPLDAVVSNNGVTVSNGGSYSTGTTGFTAGLSTVAFAVFVTLTTDAAWSGYTNGFTELMDIPVPALGRSMAVARKYLPDTTGTLECTATMSTAGIAQTGYFTLVSYRAADAPVVAPLVYFSGFDWGTSGGLGATGAANSLWGHSLSPSGTWNTNYLIQSASARTTGYGLRVVQSAAAAYCRLGNAGSSIRTLTAGFNVRVVSATGTPAVAEFTDQVGSTRWAQVLYDATNNKFGVRAGTTGTVSWQSGTTALSTWVWIDVRCRINATTWQVDWRIETATDTYTDQTSATLAGQSGTGSFSALHLGANQAQTVTADFDDVVFSRYWSAYPLGPHQCRILTVDPAGTPTVSGTTTNFSVFTANTTLGAWNATNARNAVDEVPPTISAAADGVTQTANAASDYIEFPMSTYTLGATEFINGVKMLAPLWSGSGAGAGDLAIRGYDGTSETALATASQITPGSATAVSATAPVWRAAMWQSQNGWSKAELDAAALRVGFSGDATPDMGVHAVYLEVAIGKTRTQALFGDLATAEIDPTRLGTMSVTITAPDVGVETGLYYEQNAAPSTVPVAAGSTVTQQLDSETAADTGYIAAYWPPEGVPDA